MNRYFPVSRGRISAFIELLNVLGRENVRGYEYGLRESSGEYYILRDPQHWFGLIPSFGVSYDIEF